MNGDLTTLERYKLYMNVTGTGSDTLISQLISRASAQVAKFCTRRFYRQVVVDDVRDGMGTQMLMLPIYPIISVEALSILNAAQTPTTNNLTGFTFDTTKLYLLGGCKFPNVRRAVKVSYTSAFNAQETASIPATTPFTLMPTTASDDDGSGFPMVDQGVVFTSSSTPLVFVASAPAAGQYSFVPGTYTFAAADAGKQVTMNYDYIPGSVEQAVIELVAGKIKQRDNIGVSSRTLATESVSYTDRDMSKSVQGMLAPYNRRVPV